MTIRIRNCAECRKPFVVDEDFEWARLCIACWKEERGYDLTKGDKAFQAMQDAFLALQAKQEREGADAPPPPVAEHTDSLTKQRITELISLCHPDKHNGSERANEVTKWLLSLRSKK